MKRWKKFWRWPENMPKKLINFLNNNYLKIIIGLILIFAFYLRIYRLNDLLGFYYDQGRDAQVIWDLFHHGKLFLIGPTTGLAGIFRAPYFYYLIAPFYLIGHGNPLFPAIFLVTISTFAIYIIYHLGERIYSRAAGIIAALISSFSFYIVYASRWLSNPTPMLILSMILTWSMINVLDKKKWAWPVIALVAGLSLFSFGSAGELFYIPAVAIFFVWTLIAQGYGKKSSLDGRTILISVFLFILTFAPLVIFDLKHQRILSHSITETFVSKKSFTTPTKFLINLRTSFYYDVFTNKIFDYKGKREVNVLSIVALWFLISLPRLIKNKRYLIVILLLIAPIIGLYFYQGNDTVLYDYYMTGYYMIFILLFAIVLADIWKFRIGKLFVLYFFYLFLSMNLSILIPRIRSDINADGSLYFANQKQAIDWIYKDSKGIDFNIDVYVPPVIPYAYDYLFQWLGTYKYNKLPDTTNVSLLYTLYEIDPPHPKRLKAWLDRQNGIGKVEREETFGGITVQRRTRIKYE